METFGHSKKYAYLCIAIKKRALSSAGLEHLPYKQRVGGSNPSAPTSKADKSYDFSAFDVYIQNTSILTAISQERDIKLCRVS